MQVCPLEYYLAMSRTRFDLLARAIDLTLSDPVAARWRAQVCESAEGDIVELGFGAGRNLRFYPGGVRSVEAVEPSRAAWELSRARRLEFARPVTWVGSDAAALPQADGSVDMVISTWTMCTIGDIRSALAEVRRVLRPGGQLRFVEHSLAPSARVRAVQRFIQPGWGYIAGGCHVDRAVVDLLEAGGFDVAVQGRYVSGGPLVRPWGWFVTGVASPAP